STSQQRADDWQNRADQVRNGAFAHGAGESHVRHQDGVLRINCLLYKSRYAPDGCLFNRGPIYRRIGTRSPMRSILVILAVSLLFILAYLCSRLASELVLVGLLGFVKQFLLAPGRLTLLVIFPQVRHGTIDTQGEADDQLRGDLKRL